MAYRIAVIAVFAFFIAFGPFSQTVTAQMNGSNCCAIDKCCCNPSVEHISAEIFGKCSCEVSETPDIPTLPLGISDQPTSKSNTSLGTIDLKPLNIAKKLTELKSKTSDYLISLKAPPLYIINSSFLI